MKRWQLAQRRTFCGGRCVSGFIEAGQPLALVYIDGITRPRVRCEACAGPADWNQIAAWGREMDARDERTSGVIGLRDVAPRFDVRMAAAGERD
jgi:hypothetical protein